MQRVVMGIVETPRHAELAIEQLQRAGFKAEDVSVLFPDKRGAHDFAFEHRTKAPEGAIAGVGFGAILGAAVGIAAGVGVLVVPGLGALVAAGPLLASLSGAAVGGTLLGMVGAVAGARVPEIEAKHYEGKVRLGSILVGVHTATRGETQRARAILRSLAATDVTATSEAAVPVRARA